MAVVRQADQDARLRCGVKQRRDDGDWLPAALFESWHQEIETGLVEDTEALG